MKNKNVYKSKKTPLREGPKYTNPANHVRNFCKQKLAAPISAVLFGVLC